MGRHQTAVVELAVEQGPRGQDRRRSRNPVGARADDRVPEPPSLTVVDLVPEPTRFGSQDF